VAELNGVLLAVLAVGLPATTLPGARDGGSAVAWWELDTGGGYLRGQLIWHLIEAAQGPEAAARSASARASSSAGTVVL
jgi:hypothetical protein